MSLNERNPSVFALLHFAAVGVSCLVLSGLAVLIATLAKHLL